MREVNAKRKSAPYRQYKHKLHILFNVFCIFCRFLKKSKKGLAIPDKMCYNIQGQARPISQTVKTSPSHGEDMGSIPVWVTRDTLCQSLAGFLSSLVYGMRQMCTLILYSPSRSFSGGWISSLFMKMIDRIVQKTQSHM